MNHSLSVVGMALLATVLSGPSVSAADSVTRKSDGTTVRGTFKTMARESVSLESGSGKTTEISVADIRELKFDKEPSELALARANERSGSFDSAIERLDKVLAEDTAENRDLKIEVEFLRSRTLIRQAMASPDVAEAALTAVTEFRIANPGSWRYLEATLLQAQLLLNQSQLDDARPLLEEIQRVPVPGFQLQAGVQLGRLQMADNQSSQALTSFRQVAAQAEGNADATTARFAALLGIAEVQAQQGQTDEAVATLDKLVNEASDEETEVLAEAWVLRGDVFRSAGNAKAALLSYLHVDVLYGGEAAQHAESLHRLSALWDSVGRPERGEDAAARLQALYPNTPWAKGSGTP